jgi:hypothetical protein
MESPGPRYSSFSHRLHFNCEVRHRPQAAVRVSAHPIFAYDGNRSCRYQLSRAALRRTAASLGKTMSRARVKRALRRSRRVQAHFKKNACGNRTPEGITRFCQSQGRGHFRNGRRHVECASFSPVLKRNAGWKINSRNALC